MNRRILPVSSTLFVRLISLIAMIVSQMASAMTLDEAVSRALNSDEWIEGSRLQQEAKTHLGEAAGTLPDPTFNVGVNGLPLDSLDFDQEPMTQTVIGVSQMFPRGDTLSLTQSRFDKEASLEPIERAERKAQVRQQVSQLWLDAWGYRRSIDLIKSNRGLFEQMREVVTASYVSSYGKARQQDLVRAELEIAQIDDRLTSLKQKYDASRAGLLRWVSNASEVDLEIGSKAMPAGALTPTPLVGDDSELARHFTGHPTVALIDARIDVASTVVDLARQSYKPQWGLKAQYGARLGDRPDMVSVGLSVSVPLFSTSRQDSQVSAATARKGSIRTERVLALRNLVSQYRAAWSNYQRLEDRLGLYRDRVLPQASQSAKAALNAYQSDDGDFAEVVRARIAELNAQLKVIELKVQKHQQAVRMNYLTTEFDAKENQA